MLHLAVFNNITKMSPMWKAPDVPKALQHYNLYLTIECYKILSC